jgi:hypothetical protein
MKSEAIVTVPGNCMECPNVILHMRVHGTVVTNSKATTSPDYRSNIFSLLEAQIQFQTMEYGCRFTLIIIPQKDL